LNYLKYRSLVTLSLNWINELSYWFICTCIRDVILNSLSLWIFLFSYCNYSVSSRNLYNAF